MGSQTLEILRQGVWASLTGGWFYDPHQNLFCNTVHLYIWLFLLCLPFSVYLYFPPASLGWIIYCALVALLFTCLKLLNHGLHHMYDTSECIIIQPSGDASSSNNNTAPEEGMEMQMLRLGGATAAGSDNESVTSLEYHKPNNSTIDLKVDVHRKNSSESSIEDSATSAKPPEAVATTKSDLCVSQAIDMPGPSKARPPNRSRSKSGHKRDHRPKTRRTHGNRIDELIVEEASKYPRLDNNLPVHMFVDEGPFAKVSRRYHECSHTRRGSSNRDFFKEWLYLDANEAAGEPYQSKFARQLSSDSRDNSEPNVGPPSPKKRIAHRRRYTNYPDESCTKSAMALATAQSSNMRRNSNSTMSTIQLPLLNSTAQLVSHMRRHSNNADTGFFASVELGEYMMVKAEVPSGETDKNKGKSPGVRRIKSAALEIGCPPPSVSNLSPHPNSAETIGGQMLKNPKSAVIPPPSKSLTRGPHLNLYPKNDSGEGCSYPYLTYGSEIVYPIAEISDEMQTSQKETDLDSSGESYSDYDDEKQFRGFDWDAEQSSAMRSSDSDFENNGSRSPLLDRSADIRVVRTKNHSDCKKPCCDRHSNSKLNPDCSNEKMKPVRLKKVMKSDPQYDSKRPGPSTSCECKFTPNVDYFDKASASSKDLLIEKSSLESNENHDHKVKKPDIRKVVEKKPWDHNISNSSSSSDTNVDRPQEDNKDDKNTAPETEESQLTGDSKSADERSVYSLDWLFEETTQPKASIFIETEACSSFMEPETFSIPNEEMCQKLANALGESSSNVPKNLGAIPKQVKNLARSRASSQKENKKRDSKDSKKDKDENLEGDRIFLDAVEAQAALVQGLECLFAATNANTVVMPPPNRDERPRHRHSIRGERENAHKTRKRSIEEVAQQSTNTLLPTSMPLLAAFLNSRVDFMPCCVPDGNAPAEPAQNVEEGPRLRPLMDRNHRNRVRKIKRSTRQRNNPSQSNPDKKDKPANSENPNNSNSVHFATSFEDTTDGAIHCFMDEYGNWMSYTFDKNSSGRVQAQPIPLPEKEDSIKLNRVKPIDNPDNSQETAGEGSCGSLESEAGNSEILTKKRGDSIDQSSSNQGSNNPLLSSTNNVSTVVAINTNNANKRFYVFDGGTGSHTDQPRSPVAYVTDSLLEQIEAERQSRMGLPSMHINFLMSQQRAQQQPQQPAENTSANIPSLMPSIGEESVEINIRSKFSKIMDEMEKANQPKPKSYYKFKLSKCFEVKVTMDRLKLMALFDRNLTFRETFVSIVLAIMVAVLGSMVLNLGFYRDIYAFWFCFIMAGSQYSLLKSVQPDSASPVHGFNKMVVFSRPVYFCLCSAILCAVNSYLGQSDPTMEETHIRNRRSVEELQPLLVYGFELNERDFFYVIQEILSKFLLFFPMAFSFGLFPQVNTFLMYLLEQIDMHVFGGNATSSLSAAVYCVVRSVAAIGVLYGFAYSGLVEGKKSQHQKHNVLFSIFCGLLVPIAYHLSRSASDYTLIWNLIKKHLLPPELYVIHSPDCSPDVPKDDPNTLSDDKKNNSESNISKQHSIGSSASKINFSSETNIARTQKRSQTSSVSSLRMDPRAGDTMNSTTSLKLDPPTETEDKSHDSNTNNSASNKQDQTDKPDEDMEDPLPKKLQATVNARLKNDVIVCTFLGLFVFGLHCTTVFTTLRPQLNMVLWIIASILGWVLHYLTPQLRKQQPWLCLAGPVLRQHEHAQFEVTEPARLMCFEKIFVYLCFLERNVLYPAVVIAATTQDAPAIAAKYGDAVGALIICMCALKCLRNAYSEPESQYLILVFAFLLFQRDLSSRNISETFLVDYFITAIIFSKVYEFLLKIQFVVTYIAPWQITWGSAFHAFAQPFSVPHSAMLFLQCGISALLSSPLTPALGMYQITWGSEFHAFAQPFSVPHSAMLFLQCGISALLSSPLTPALGMYQITWGSAFHAFAQPFSVPHSAMLFLQCGISALLSSPLTPALGMYQITWGSEFHAFAQPFSVPHSAMLFLQCGISALLSSPLTPALGMYQITWGSAFHAFAQPFSVPHSAMLFLQCGISALLSSPLTPALGMYQITWGSAFHAFAQPFSVPHSAMLFLQCGISALLSSPLTPALGMYQITWGSEFHAFAQPFSVPHSAMLFLQCGISALLSSPLTPALGMYQITWGSEFHAFAQPFSVPHSAMLFLQCGISALLSSPLTPALGMYQITWGSEFHAFAQPFSVPHSAMLFLQCGISALLSSPLTPALGMYQITWGSEFHAFAQPFSVPHSAMLFLQCGISALLSSPLTPALGMYQITWGSEFHAFAQPFSVPHSAMLFLQCGISALLSSPLTPALGMYQITWGSEFHAFAQPFSVPHSAMLFLQCGISALLSSPLTPALGMYQITWGSEFHAFAQPFSVPHSAMLFLQCGISALLSSPLTPALGMYQITWGSEFHAFAQPFSVPHSAMLFLQCGISALLSSPLTPALGMYQITWGSEFHAFAQPFSVPHSAMLFLQCGISALLSSPLTPALGMYQITWGSEFHAFAQPFSVPHSAMLFLQCGISALLSSPLTPALGMYQITWGSEFHAFAQPFSVPHSAMLFLQCGIFALLSSPLIPALGSAIFMTSYVRPVKFWERDYNTKRVDQSNTRLSSQLERNLGADDNNLNSIFYEHLTRSLQHYLCGDLMLGRWGQVQQGDCFVLASDYLNCLVHIVEMGNGLVSFQLRGLEFRGTYCQQREVEAISEGPEESSEGVCTGLWWCGGRVLAPGAAWALRWLAWQLASARYVLEGYSVSDNSAVSMLQVFDFRKVLLTYYVKSIIYYTIQSSKLEEWLSSPVLSEALKPMNERAFVDLDPIFNVNLDEDYDFRAAGITRSRFCAIYQEWIVHCGVRRGAGWRRRAAAKDSSLVTLCFALSLLGRRALAAAQHLSASSVEFFLYGLHSLFKGDFRITCARDEWVFTDMSLLHAVLAPAIRMALKLHQDHFMFPEEYCSSSALYSAISSHAQRLVICHEAAPAWRYNVLRGAPHLLALRHVMDDGNDDYKIIMLNKRHLGFRVIKLNRECVRGLWAGQQQELVYLRNRNPERGSIQNAKQALRNIINSSCDQPIGYPIYVSPLTTSYADTSPQLCSLLGGPVTVTAIKDRLTALWRRIRRRCGEGCSSGGGAAGPGAAEAGAARSAHTPRHNALHLSRTSLAGTRGSLASAGKPTSSTLASLAGLLREHSHERTLEEAAYGSAGAGAEGGSPRGARAREERAGSAPGGRRERNMRARTAAKEPARQASSSSRRLRRERAPASFRLLAASDNIRMETGSCQGHYDSTQGPAGSGWEGAWRDQPRRAASAKVCSGGGGGGGAESSLEELPAAAPLDLSLPDCKIIANRNARQERDFSRYFINEGTSKDLSKPSKEIRHERESYRELTGRYIEKPETIALKETHYSDLSHKESVLKKEAKKDPKAKEIKTKIKRSDSGKSELKINVSVGSKVLITEPLGVYDCINLGRRIDVQWPAEQQRERGGRNYWGAWVPRAGMDGLVVHKWTPNHRDPKLRSHVDKSILLIEIDDKFVPIAENCVQDLGDEV